MNANLFVTSYLARLKLEGPITADSAALRVLHKHHLGHIPFENLDVISGRRLQLEPDQLWEKIVVSRRGGICYELNGLFLHLLRLLGFQAAYLAARVEENGSQFDHVLLLVQAEDGEWLADVGFGDHFLEPIRWDVGAVQQDPNGYFRITAAEEGNYLLEKSSQREGPFKVEYTFSLQARTMEDFRERCEYYETSPDSLFRRGRICSLERESSRISLTANKLILTENGVRTEISISGEEEFLGILQQRFGFAVPGDSTPVIK